MGATAVVVLYEPDDALLLRQFQALRDQVDAVHYFDNGGGIAALARTGIADEPGVGVFGEGANVGLATALNLSLLRLGTEGHALLLDQDSIPAPDLVATLRRGFDTPHRHSVLAVGPAIMDELEERPEYFTRLRLLRNRRIASAADAGSEFFDVDFLITSGTMIDLSQLGAAGLNDESLFIDCVDFDWSFAATARRFALLATFSTTLSHRRGDNLVHAPGGLAIRVHSPARLYYMHRNRVRLYRRRYVPLAWKVHDLGRMIVKFGLLMAFVPRRRERLIAISRGLRDGVRDVGGPDAG